MTLGHTIGMVLGLVGSAIAAFLAADPTVGTPEIRSALAGLVAALAAVSVGLQAMFPRNGGTDGGPQAPPPSG